MKKDVTRLSALAPIAVAAGALVCAWVLSAGAFNQKGLVVLPDTSYHAVVLGSSRDGFTVPDGILWHRGKFIIADEGGKAVRIWSSARDVRTLCDSSLGILSPEDIVMDAEGDLFFTDDDAGGVWEVAANGKAFLLAGKSKGLVSTEGIVLAPSGVILVGDGVRHEIFSVTRQGAVSVFLGPEAGITKPESMVFDEKGDLYIADNSDQILYVLTPKGTLRRVVEGRDDFSPETIWYAHHRLYITDSENEKLYCYKPEEGLTVFAVFGGDLGHLCGITTDDQDNIYVSVQTDLKHKQGYILKLEHDGTGFPSALGNGGGRRQ